ncbi:MAG TPA: hypothetical protein VLA11_09790 [Woeseiaceae bacterium]|nr:hypothetical protein [Woeseiaceae bacterium]
MASAEHLLHEAQYAFNSITYGDTRDNRRNASRASKLCRKIIRMFPGTMEESEAHAILRRMGEEAFLPKLAVRHQHISGAEHHRPRRRPANLTNPGSAQQSAVTPEMRTFMTHEAGDSISFDWGGLMSLLFMVPKIVLGAIAVAGIFLFGLFGWLILVPLVLAVLVLGPAKPFLNRQQRGQVDTFIATANKWIAERQSKA